MGSCGGMLRRKKVRSFESLPLLGHISAGFQNEAGRSQSNQKKSSTRCIFGCCGASDQVQEFASEYTERQDHTCTTQDSSRRRMSRTGNFRGIYPQYQEKE